MSFRDSVTGHGLCKLSHLDKSQEVAVFTEESELRVGTFMSHGTVSYIPNSIIHDGGDNVGQKDFGF